MLEEQELFSHFVIYHKNIIIDLTCFASKIFLSGSEQEFLFTSHNYNFYTAKFPNMVDGKRKLNLLSPDYVPIVSLFSSRPKHFFLISSCLTASLDGRQFSLISSLCTCLLMMPEVASEKKR